MSSLNVVYMLVIDISVNLLCRMNSGAIAVLIVSTTSACLFFQTSCMVCCVILECFGTTVWITGRASD